MNPGDPIQAGVVIEIDAGGLSFDGVSVQFDTQELSLSGADPAQELAPPAPVANFDAGVDGFAEDIGGGHGLVSTFEGATLATGLVKTSFLAANIYSTADSLDGDGTDIDIEPGLYDVGVDFFSDNGDFTVTRPRFWGRLSRLCPNRPA